MWGDHGVCRLLHPVIRVLGAEQGASVVGVLDAGRLLAAELLPCRLPEAYLVELLLLWLVGGRHD